MNKIKNFIPHCERLVKDIYSNANISLKSDEIKGKTYCVYDFQNNRLCTDFFNPRELYIFLCGYYQGKSRTINKGKL